MPNRSRVRRCRERDSPEILGLVIVLHELDSVRRCSRSCGQNRHHPRRDLSPPLVLQNDDGTHRNIPTQVQGGSVAVQIRRFRRHRERTLLRILAAKPDGSMECHTTAATLRDLNSIQCGCCQMRAMMRSSLMICVFRGHVFWTLEPDDARRNVLQSPAMVTPQTL